MVRSILQPLFAGLLAAFMACVPGKAPVSPGTEYTARITACSATAKTLKESCECRKAVDEEFKLCDHPDWPAIGRCDVPCEDK